MDFGQNINGHVRLVIRNPVKGRRISIAYAETLLENGELKSFTSVNYQRGENGPHCDTYVPKGEAVEIYESRFSNHGFRYADIVNYPDAKCPAMEDVTAIVVHSPVQNQSTFSCSDQDINRLFKISYWSQRCNLASVPTDCPTRKRHGWLGDAWVACQSECIQFDLLTFYESRFRSIADDQRDNGNVQYITPFQSSIIDGNVDIPWSYACVTMPLMIYRAYGDGAILSQAYPVITKWVDFMKTILTEDGLIKGGVMWNDHTAKYYMNYQWIGNLYFYATLKDAVTIADILGEETAEFNRLLTSTKTALLKQFKKQNTFVGNTQGDLVHVLSLGLGKTRKFPTVCRLYVMTSKKKVIVQPAAVSASII